MDNIQTVFVIVILISLAGVLAFFIYSHIMVKEEESLEQMVRVSRGFSDFEPVDSPRGECLVYQTFSTEKAIVDTLEPLGNLTSYVCNDGFIQVLSLNQHICEDDTCIGYDGNDYSRGDVEQVYLKCEGVETCQSGRSVVMIPQLPNVTDSRCLRIQGQSFQAVQCPTAVEVNDPVFLTADSEPVTTGSNIPQVRIKQAYTSTCLVPSSSLNDVQIRDCDTSPRKGYTWMVIPEIAFLDGSYYPSSIATIPEDLTAEDLLPENIVNTLLKTKALGSTTSGQVVINQQVTCDLETSCNTQSAIVPAYLWPLYLRQK